jgi:plastocyanin
VGLFRKSDKPALGAAAAAFSLLAMVLAFAALVVTASNSNSSGGTVVATGGVSVTLSEFKLTPDTVTTSSGSSITVTNGGTVVHNLTIKGTDKHTKDLQPGESAVLSLAGLKDGTYEMMCAIPGHEGAGMKGTLTVGAGGGSGAAAQSGTAGGTAQQLLASNAADDANQKKPVDAYVGQLAAILANAKKTGKIDPALYKANTSYGTDYKAEGGNPLLGPPVLKPTVLADGTKRFDITAKVVNWEIEPNKFVSAWTYNGQVPGPTIHVEPGDKVEVVLKNELPQSTAIHFHGIDVPVAMDGVPWVTQDPVKPGGSFTYKFTAANHLQIGMYHSHHHGEHQVPDGLMGAFIVGDPPAPAGYDTAAQFPAANTPYIMVLNDAGSIGLSLNGKSFPATAPVVTPVGKWIEIDYMNEGLQIHPMHLHGPKQLVIAEDGNMLAQPYYVDTLMVAPGQRFTVLVKPDASFLDNSAKPYLPALHAGVWAFHCHILSHAERNDGMFGMVTTYIVLPQGTL